jgi:hypothetical protein
MMRGGVSAIVTLGLCEGGCLDGSLQHPNVETNGLKKNNRQTTACYLCRAHPFTVVRVRSTPEAVQIGSAPELSGLITLGTGHQQIAKISCRFYLGRPKFNSNVLPAAYIIERVSNISNTSPVVLKDSTISRMLPMDSSRAQSLGNGSKKPYLSG